MIGITLYAEKKRGSPLELLNSTEQANLEAFVLDVTSQVDNLLCDITRGYPLIDDSDTSESSAFSKPVVTKPSQSEENKPPSHGSYNRLQNGYPSM